MEHSSHLMHSANQIGLNFINNLTQPAGSNAAFSPWSLMSVLSMLLLGISQQSSVSHGELSTVLGLGTGDAAANHHKSILEANRRLVSALEKQPSNDSSVDFKQGNLLVYNKDLVSLKPDYQQLVKSLYSAQVDQFSTGYLVHELINSWVTNATRGMITELADASISSDPNFVFALMNAAYFKGNWLKEFAPPRKSSFFNVNLTNQDATVDIVSVEDSFEYAEFDVPKKHEWLLSFVGASEKPVEKPEPSVGEKQLLALTKDLNCKVLVLPYQLNGGNEFSMVLLLPHKYDGVETLQRKLNSTILEAIYKSVEMQKVRVTVPKFSIDSSYDAKEVLSSMGLKNVFGPQPGLDSLFAGSETKIGKVLHKTKLRLDENGSEASSASYLEGVLTSSLFSMPTTFFANHPFLFIIRHNPTNVPLFMGRVCNP